MSLCLFVGCLLDIFDDNEKSEIAVISNPTLIVFMHGKQIKITKLPDKKKITSETTRSPFDSFWRNLQVTFGKVACELSSVSTKLCQTVIKC